MRYIALTCMVFSLSFSYGHAQDPEYIQGWTALEEADFYFDVTYAVVKCSSDASPVILLNAFNEGGNVSSIGLVLELTDANGNESVIEVPTFDIAFAEMQIAGCDSSENGHLKFDVPDGMDATSLSIEITYQKGL